MLWNTYKEDIAKLVKETAKKSYYKLNSHMEVIERDLQVLRTSPDYDINNTAHMNAAFLTNVGGAEAPHVSSKGK
jgi:hypothetical protein